METEDTKAARVFFMPSVVSIFIIKNFKANTMSENLNYGCRRQLGEAHGLGERPITCAGK